MTDDQLNKMLERLGADVKRVQEEAESMRNDPQAQQMAARNREATLTKFRQLHLEKAAKTTTVREQGRINSVISTEGLVTTRRTNTPTPRSWLSRLFGSKEQQSWFASPGFAVVVVMLLAIAGAFLFLPGGIPLEPAGAKSPGQTEQPALNLNIPTRKASFKFSQTIVLTTLTTLPSNGADVELYQVEPVGSDAQAKSPIIKGTLRLLRSNAAKPIKGKRDLASGRFAGTVQTDGKAPEPVTWIYQPRR